MPLKEGSSNEVISSNIKELMQEVSPSGDGKIGNYRPPNRKKAQQVAVAIALNKAGKSKKK